MLLIRGAIRLPLVEIKLIREINIYQYKKDVVARQHLLHIQVRRCKQCMLTRLIAFISDPRQAGGRVIPCYDCPAVAVMAKATTEATVFCCKCTSLFLKRDYHAFHYPLCICRVPTRATTTTKLAGTVEFQQTGQFLTHPKGKICAILT